MEFFYRDPFLARLACLIVLPYLMFAVCGRELFMLFAVNECMDRSRIQPVVLLHRLVHI